ncbi:MAG: hypothetical protein WC593_15730 [Methanoregula sp.]
MVDKELQELRDWSARKMGWFKVPAFKGWLKKAYPDYSTLVFADYQGDWTPDLPNGQIEMFINRMVELGWNFAFFGWSEDGTCSALFYRPEDHAFCIDNLLDDDRVVSGKDRLKTILLAGRAAQATGGLNGL